MNKRKYIITQEDFNAIEEALRLLPSGKDFLNLPVEVQNIIAYADNAVYRTYRRKFLKKA